MTRDLDADLAFAEHMARTAGEIALQHFRRHDLRVETKGDSTPVTAADREAEEACRLMLAGRCPDDGVVGEEHGADRADAEWRWVLDPIDGTRTFVRGVPLFGVLIALQHAGRSVVGVMHFPALDETISAATGKGCRANGRRARVSDVRRIDHALLLTTDIADVAASPLAAGFDRLQRHAAMVRTWGDCYGHALVATGRAEIMFDPVLALWDVAALVPIVREAGGCFFDLSGREDGVLTSGIATNAALQGSVRTVLGIG